MKDFILYVLIAVLLLGVFITPIIMLSDPVENLHIRFDKVQVIEAYDGVYAVVDGSGEVWEFESNSTYFVNEVLTVKFDTKGTESIYDDAIIAIKR
jgi:hypothetical protein